LSILKTQYVNVLVTLSSGTNKESIIVYTLSTGQAKSVDMIVTVTSYTGLLRFFRQ